MTNIRAIGLMVAAVAAFAVSDALVKVITQSISVPQTLCLVAIGNLIWFVPRLRLAKTPIFSRDAFNPAVALRSFGEVFGSFGIVGGLAVLPLATVSAIMQAQPLVVMLVAAVFLGETVGWRRWAAVGVGFVGVMLIIRPSADFDLAMLLPLFGVLGLTARDVGTRLLPSRISADFAIIWAVIPMIVITGIVTTVFSGWQTVSPTLWLWLAACTVAITVAYIFITAAFRAGEVSAVAPFRYTRMVFALFIAMVFFGERPDLMVWLGIGLIIGSGLYALWRETLSKTVAR